MIVKQFKRSYSTPFKKSIHKIYRPKNRCEWILSHKIFEKKKSKLENYYSFPDIDEDYEQLSGICGGLSEPKFDSQRHYFFNLMSKNIFLKLFFYANVCLKCTATWID